MAGFGVSSPSEISLKLRIEKELAPKVAKFELIEPSSASIAVRIPMSAINPIAMIVMVIMLRKRLALIARNASDMFSFSVNY